MDKRLCNFICNLIRDMAENPARFTYMTTARVAAGAEAWELQLVDMDASEKNVKSSQPACWLKAS